MERAERAERVRREEKEGGGWEERGGDENSWDDRVSERERGRDMEEGSREKEAETAAHALPPHFFRLSSRPAGGRKPSPVPVLSRSEIGLDKDLRRCRVSPRGTLEGRPRRAGPDIWRTDAGGEVRTVENIAGGLELTSNCATRL